MISRQNRAVTTLVILAVSLAWTARLGLSQVNPAEILNPKLKALEKADLDQLIALNHAISGLQFPFKLVLTRYVGLDPKDQIGADTRGLEFVNFHGRTILKCTANYNAAFNSELLTQNRRANQVVDDVVMPILGLMPKHFPSPEFEGFGFEISYHVRTRNKQFGYEGKEILVLVLDKADVPAYLSAQGSPQKQEIIDRSEVFVNGTPFGLALGQQKPFDVEGLDKSAPRPPAQAEVKTERQDERAAEPAPPRSTSDVRRASLYQDVRPTSTTAQLSKSAAISPITVPPATATGPATAPAEAAIDALQKKYQPQLEAFAKEGLTRFHFVDYSPPSFVVFHNQIYLQLTLRNPAPFDITATSIYKPAAQSFDLFLAPQLHGLLAKIPTATEISGLDVTVLDAFLRSPASSSSSEALEFICPLSPLRQFVNAEITNQDLINQSVVLVNGVRIALNLQQVE